MHRTEGQGHDNNRFVDEDPDNGVPGTTLTAEWLNSIQEELINILTVAGINPSKADNTQLAAAFAVLGGSNTWGDISGKPDLLTETQITTAITNAKKWINITGKPSLVTPTQLGTAITSAKKWINITGKPSLVTPTQLGTAITSAKKWINITGKPNLLTQTQITTAITNAKKWTSITGKPSLVTPAQLTEKFNDALPVGFVFTSASQTIPAGFLECNGASLSTTTYAGLFSKIGTRFGSRSGRFNLPDLRGEFIRGWDHGRGVDGGRAFGSHQGDIFKSHFHIQGIKGDSSHTAYGYTNVSQTSAGTPNYQNSVTYPHTSSTGGGETRPKNTALIHCIKY